ncbi:MAG: hypothetical protein J0L75_13050 [Spirochaetes bacterium]|nr:hypothetical protein [Spirochaetota bacterium]
MLGKPLLFAVLFALPLGAQLRPASPAGSISGMSTLETGYLFHNNGLLDPTQDGDVLMAPGWNPRLKQLFSGVGSGFNWTFLLDMAYNKQVDSLMRETWLTAAESNFKTTPLERAERLIDTLTFSMETPLWRFTLGDQTPDLGGLVLSGKRVRGLHLDADGGAWRLSAFGGWSSPRLMALTESETNSSFDTNNDLDQNGYLTQNPTPAYRRFSAGALLGGVPVKGWRASLSAYYEEDATNAVGSNEATALPPVARLLLGTRQDIGEGPLRLAVEGSVSRATSNRLDGEGPRWAFGTRSSLTLDRQPVKGVLGVAWYQPHFTLGGIQTFSEEDRLESTLDFDVSATPVWVPGLSYRLTGQAVSAGLVASNLEHEGRLRLGVRPDERAELLAEFTGRLREGEQDAELSLTARDLDLKFTRLSPGVLGRWYERTNALTNAQRAIEGRLDTRNRWGDDRVSLATTHRFSWRIVPVTAARAMEWNSGFTAGAKLVPRRLGADLGANVQFLHEELTGTNQLTQTWRVSGQVGATWNVNDRFSAAISYRPAWVQARADGVVDPLTQFTAHAVNVALTAMY